MISKFFIEHPVLANVLAIVLVVIGAVSLYRLPVSEYPNVVPPTVAVTASYAGASAQTVVNTVALPIENQVNGVDHMLYMQSTSAPDGTYNLTVTFEIGTDPNIDQVLVQNRVQLALASLPQAVQAQGVSVQKKNTAILQIVTLDSPDGKYDSLFMANYATINLVDELARLPGVGSVTVFGAGDYSMRIWMDPQKLQSYGLQPSDVILAIKQQNQNIAAGQVGMPPAPDDTEFQYTVDVKSRLDEPEEFGSIVIKDQTAQGGRLIHLRDVARIELGAQTYAQDFRLNGKPAAGIGIYQTPEANSLQVGKEVKATMDRAVEAVPRGPALRHPLRHHDLHQRLDQRGLQDAVRGRHPGADRHPRLPAELPRHAGAGDDRAGHDHRRFRRHGGAGLHGQPLDPVRHRAGDRHRGRRRDRHRRGRDEIHRAAACPGHDSAITGDGRAVRADHRHHAGADGGVHPGRLRAGPDRQHVRPVRAGHRRDRLHQRDQRGDAEADAMRPMAAHARAAGEAQLLLPLLQPSSTTRRSAATPASSAGWCKHSGLMVHPRADRVGGLGFWGLTRIPTAFIPIDDQGYLMLAVQLPEGASLGRTTDSLKWATKRRWTSRASTRSITDSGLSVLDNSAHLFNAGVAWVDAEAVRGAAEGQGPGSRCRSTPGSRRRSPRMPDGRPFVLPPPAIQGIGNAGGFQMQLELLGGSTDYQKLGNLTDQIVAQANADPSLAHVLTTFHTDAPAGHAVRRPRPGADAESQRRRHLLDADRLCRLDLRQPVQQIRPVAAGLRAGGLASTGFIPKTCSTSTCAARTARWCRSARSPISARPSRRR